MEATVWLLIFSTDVAPARVTRWVAAVACWDPEQLLSVCRCRHTFGVCENAAQFLKLDRAQKARPSLSTPAPVLRST